MVDIVSQASQITGIGGGGGGTSILFILAVSLGGLLIAGALGFLVYWYIIGKKFKYKIEIYQRVDGRLRKNFVDKARAIRLPKSTTIVFHLKKANMTIPKPTYQTGKNTYWMYESDDGSLINFDLADLDLQRLQAGGRFVTKGMRLAEGSIDYMTKERYDKTGFLEKYGGLIAYSVLIIITMVGLFLILNEMGEVASQSAGASQATAEVTERVLDRAERILGIVEQLNSPSGIVPAEVPNE